MSDSHGTQTLTTPVDKPGLHPRNQHRQGYDFAALLAATPSLQRFLKANLQGGTTIDFANPAAVKALNRALLRCHYDVAGWDIPAGYLCPAIPGRADYLHYLADLLASDNLGELPRGWGIRALDIGVGANCAYPLIGQHEYGWSFLGVDIDPQALTAAQKTLAANPRLDGSIVLRPQTGYGVIFKGLLKPGELFDVTLCNPPFHGSLEEAQAGTRRKLNALSKSEKNGKASSKSGKPASRPQQNFAGHGRELFCPGGEAAFVHQLVEESASIKERCLWFTSLVSKEDNLPAVYRSFKEVGVSASRTLEMTQGQKKSRVVAWTFLDAKAHALWRSRRWRS